MASSIRLIIFLVLVKHLFLLMTSKTYAHFNIVEINRERIENCCWKGQSLKQKVCIAQKVW